MRKFLFRTTLLLLVAYVAFSFITVKSDANDDCNNGLYTDSFDHSACEYFDVQRLLSGPKARRICGNIVLSDDDFVYIPIIGCFVKNNDMYPYAYKWHWVKIFWVDVAR